MATRKQIAAARRNIKKAHAALRKSGRHSGRHSGGRKSGGGRQRSACINERWTGPCRNRAGVFKSC